MKSFKWLKANTWDKWSLTTKILLIFPIVFPIVIGLILFGISESRSVSYEETRQLMEDSAKISAQWVINANLNEELYKKTGYNLTEIYFIANKFKDKAKKDYDSGLAYFNLGEYNSAIHFFNDSLKDKSSENNSEFYIGTSYIYLEKYDEAREWFEKCSDNFQCISQMGGTYAFEGDYKNAVLYYEKSLSIIPTTLDYYNLGTVYAKIGGHESFQKALFNFDQALKFNDKQFENTDINRDIVKFSKAYVLMKLSKYEEAKTLFEEVENNGRSDSGIFANLAIVHSELNNPIESEEYAKKAIKIEPNKVDAHKVLIISYYDTKRYYDLVKEYENNKELLSSPYFLSLIGGAYSAIGLPHIGIPILLSILNNTEVDLEMIYVTLGASYAMIDNNETSLFYINKALDINPHNKEAIANLEKLKK